MISGLSRTLAHQKSEQKHGFLQFSSKLDYGLFLLIELARVQNWSIATGPLAMRGFAEQHQMSFLFLQKVAFELRRAGLVRADRGKNGGYLLARSAKEISLKEVIEVLEGPLSVMHCMIPGVVSNCSRLSGCKMRHGLGTVNNAIVNIFTETTLLTLIQKHE